MRFSIRFLLLLPILILLQACQLKNHLPVDLGEIEFNSDWKFLLGDDSTAYQIAYPDESWRSLNLPHDWSIEGDFDANHPATNQGGSLPGGVGWYRKTFDVSRSKANQQVYINFDGVYRYSKVWINGHLLGERPSGYVAFQYNITPYLTKDGLSNVLAVRVDNSKQPNSRWYSGSGIYRDVHLIVKNEISIDHWGAFVTTSQVSQESALVRQETVIRNSTGSSQEVEIGLSIVDAGGKTMVSSSFLTQLNDTVQKVDYELTLGSPELWSVENPNLYYLKTVIKQDDTILDQHIERFGVRYFNFDVSEGFSLNGTAMKLLGVCMHHDLGALGAAVNRRAIQRQLEILKEMGANAIRISHNPPAKQFLEVCDEMGFLVINESFDIWKKKKNKFDYHLDFEEWHKRDLQDWVKRDRNHPSIIMWSIGNEIREQFDSTGVELTKSMVKIVKELDSTRPVTAALTETNYEKNYIAQSEALDVLGFNYKYFDYPKLPAEFPGKPLIASETTSALASRGDYDLGEDTLRLWPANGKQKYVENGNADFTVSAYDHIAAYWGTSHEKAWTAVKNSPFLGGIFVWTGFDYLGEPVPYPFPARSSYYGIIDLAGFPKDVYYMYKSEWTNDPVLHVFPHWNWKSGQEVDIWAYYNNADEVELLLNGKSLGRKKKVSDALHVSWKVPFEAGTLKAISRKNGSVVMSKEIHTAGEVAKVQLTADRQTIQSDGKDLSFITVELLDAEGNLVPTANNWISFGIEGAGEIAGIDNGFQADLEPFTSLRRRTHNGKALVIIQSNGKPGKINLKATLPGLESQIITIKTEPKRRSKEIHAVIGR